MARKEIPFDYRKLLKEFYLPWRPKNDFVYIPKYESNYATWKFFG